MFTNIILKNLKKQNFRNSLWRKIGQISGFSGCFFSSAIDRQSIFPEESSSSREPEKSHKKRKVNSEQVLIFFRPKTLVPYTLNFRWYAQCPYWYYWGRFVKIYNAKARKSIISDFTFKGLIGGFQPPLSRIWTWKTSLMNDWGTTYRFSRTTILKIFEKIDL